VTSSLDQRLHDHIHYAYTHAPAIRQIMDKAGVAPSDIKTTADMAKIPVTPKDKMPELQGENPPFGGFLAVDPSTLGHIFISPGPIYEPRRDNSAASSALKALSAVGLGKGDVVINTYLYHLTPAGLLMDEALRLAGCTVIPTGPGNTDLQVMIAMRLGVTGFVGTPSFMATFFDTVIKFGMNPKDLPLKKAFFSAEPYPLALRKRFDKDYGMATRAAYGTAELGIIGYEVPEISGYVVSDNLYVEVVDPTSGQNVGEGEVGEVVVTLFDTHYPLIRYGTGDLGALAPTTHEGASVIAGLYGRSGGAIKVRGMFLHPNQIEAIADKIEGVKYAQAIITRENNRDHLQVRVQLKGNFEGDREALAHLIKQGLQDAARLKVDEVAFVESGVIDPAQRSVRDERKWD
jgi:phenylacetate-CoA ligase